MSATTELVAPSAEEEALAIASKESMNDGHLVVPILKICQSLTDAVVNDEAKPGDFVNALTGENFGSAIDFVVVGYEKGRFYSAPKSDQSFGTTDAIAPGNWPEEYAGRPFAEIDDAEERFKERVDAEVIEWGSGPPISTTHNFVGLVVGSEIPVRLSLMRAQTPAASKIKTLVKFARSPWDKVFHLSTESRTSSRSEPYKGLVVKQGPVTDAETRQLAVTLAQAVLGGRISEAPAEHIADAPVEPEKGDGLAID